MSSFTNPRNLKTGQEATHFIIIIIIICTYNIFIISQFLPFDLVQDFVQCKREWLDLLQPWLYFDLRFHLCWYLIRKKAASCGYVDPVLNHSLVHTLHDFFLNYGLVNLPNKREKLNLWLFMSERKLMIVKVISFQKKVAGIGKKRIFLLHATTFLIFLH